MTRTASPAAALPRAELDDLAARITARLGLRACWFEPFPFERLLPRLERDRVVIPAREPVLLSCDERQATAGLELPVRYRGLKLGRFVLVTARPTCGVAISSSARSEAISIADRAGEQLARSWIAADRRPDAERGLLP